MSEAVRLEVEGLRDLLGRYARTSDEGLRRRQDQMLRAVAGQGKDRLSAAAPRGPGPGPHLADLFRVTPLEREGANATIAVENSKTVKSKAGATYSLLALITRGTRPHIIQGNPLLHFVAGGADVFTTTVHHPGTKASPFVANTVRDLDVQHLLMTTARGVIADLSGGT